MPSRDEDWGYDVSNYTGVHPELGTLEDLDTLIAEAAKRNLRVLLTWCRTTAAPRTPGSSTRPQAGIPSTVTITCGRIRRPAAARRTTGWTRRDNPPGSGMTAPGSTTCTTSWRASRT